MSEVEGMDMIDEHDHSMNDRFGKEGMNMLDSNMVEEKGMDTVDTGIGEDRANELELVEREPEDVVLARH
jgi:hypothetical protein